jgi:hypothetical protein
VPRRDNRSRASQIVRFNPPVIRLPSAGLRKRRIEAGPKRSPPRRGISRAYRERTRLTLRCFPPDPFDSQGAKAKGGQAGVGYKGSTEAGSAPKT